MGNRVFLVGKDITQLKEELEKAAVDFTKNFQNLEVELTTLTSRGFTGGAADALIDTYTNKVKPKLEEIAKETNKAADGMAEEEEGFNKLYTTMEDMMRR